MAHAQWYMAIGGHQVGPVSEDDVIANLRNGTIDGNTLVFGEGLSSWTPLKNVGAFKPHLGGQAAGGPGSGGRCCRAAAAGARPERPRN
jgi:hypothetical protein